MAKEPKFVGPEVKLEAVARLVKGANVDELAAAIGVDRRSVYRWREVLEQHGADAFQPVGRRRRRKRPEVVDPVVKAEAAG